MTRQAGALLFAAVLLAGCGEAPPLRIGFLGELTGRSADLGESGRNGALLAIDHFKENGALQGRKIDVLVRDTGADPAAARRATEELVAAGVEVIIGPMTSGMTDAILPVIEKAGVVAISPSASGLKFHGKDDHLFRINTTAADNGRTYAQRCTERGLKRLSVVVSEDNRSFSDSWLQAFREAFEQAGGRIVTASFFDSRENNLTPQVAQFLASAPDGLVLISNAVDTARLAQLVHKVRPNLPLIASEWAATEQLIALGGNAVENMMSMQYFDKSDPSPHVVAFREGFRKRFGKDPVFGSALAYEAAGIAVDTLVNHRTRASFKQDLLQRPAFRGLQQDIKFDATGDIAHKSYFVVIRNGEFVNAQ